MKKHRQVGALPVRRKKNGDREILLITCRGSGRWIVPKGNRSRKLNDEDAAAREAKEEGGVSGKIGSRRIGKFTHRKRNGKVKAIDVYHLKVQRQSKHWPEEQERKRVWVSSKKAMKLLLQPKLRRIIARAVSSH